MYERNKKRQRKENVRLGTLNSNHTKATEFTDSDRFRVECYIPVIDQIASSLYHRIEAYSEVDSIFGFLRNSDKLTCRKIREHAI